MSTSKLPASDDIFCWNCLEVENPGRPENSNHRIIKLIKMAKGTQQYQGTKARMTAAKGLVT
jgi:hypothetical protein